MQIIGGVTGGTGTQTEHGAGNFLQHPGEVFAAHGLLDQHDGILTQLGAGRILEHGGFQVGVHDRRHTADVLHTRGHAEGHGDLLNHFVQQVACLAPYLNVQATHGARQVALGGDSVGSNAGTDLSPGDQHARTYVGAAGQHGGNLHSDLAHRVDEVLGQVRARSVATVTAQVNLDGVGCASNRTDTGTNLAQVHLRVAVQSKGARNVLQQTLRNHLHRTAGQLLLSGLEENTDATTQRGLLVQLVQCQRHTEHDGLVNIVAAGVHHAGHGRSVGQVGLLNNGQSVNIGAQSHSEGAASNIDVAAGTFASDGVHAGFSQSIHEALSGRHFTEGKLRVGVHFAAELHEGTHHALHPVVEDRGGQIVARISENHTQ